MVDGAVEIREAILEGEPITLVFEDGVWIGTVGDIPAEVCADRAGDVLRDLAIIVERAAQVAVAPAKVTA